MKRNKQNSNNSKSEKSYSNKKRVFKNKDKKGFEIQFMNYDKASSFLRKSLYSGTECLSQL